MRTPRRDAPGGGLHSGSQLTMVVAMRRRARPHPLGTVVFLLAAAACGGEAAADPRNREIPWTYGPTSSTATAEHARGTGTDGGAAMARGWQCRLQDGTHLLVQPYQLAASHPLFGKVVLTVGLFDQAGKQLSTLRSPVLTAANSTFTLELPPDVAARLWDLVFWYTKA